jgi:hypothetical protein
MRANNRGRILASVLAAAAGLFTAAAANAASMVVTEVAGAPGSIVNFLVLLDSGGAQVAGTENDIAFSAQTPLTEGETGVGTCSTTTTQNCLSNLDCPSGETCMRPTGPNCTIGFAIKGGTQQKQAAFSFVDATTMTGIVVGATSLNTTPIPDGSILYICEAMINLDTPDGDYPLTLSNLGFADPNGASIPATDGTNGTIRVKGGTVCACDCNGNGTVELGELLTGLDIVNELLPVGVCRACALGGDEVTLGNILTGLDIVNAGGDCPAQ